jgi:hypothetical protein
MILTLHDDSEKKDDTPDTPAPSFEPKNKPKEEESVISKLEEVSSEDKHDTPYKSVDTNGTSVPTYPASWVMLNIVIIISLILGISSGIIVHNSRVSDVTNMSLSELTRYQSVMRSGNVKMAGSMYSPIGYLSQEDEYSNSVKDNKDIIKLKQKLLSTVTYTYSDVKGAGYSNKHKTYPPDFRGLVPITRTNYNWATVVVDDNAIKELAKASNITKDDPDYADKVSSLFATFLLKQVNTKNLTSKIANSNDILSIQEDTVTINKKEDEYLDRALYSNEYISSIFKEFQTQVWIASGGSGEPNGRWLVPTITWMGAFKLSGGKEKHVNLPSKDAGKTKDKPAGIGVPVQTVYPDGNGNDQPISITLTKFMRGVDAIKWYESKDSRNTGYDPDSNLIQVGYTFNVVNLSTEPLTINDNSVLIDNMTNGIVRVGTLFGITDSITLQPGDSGVIESWSDATDIDRLDLVWGKGYLDNARNKLVYFDVLGEENGKQSK